MRFLSDRTSGELHYLHFKPASLEARLIKPQIKNIQQSRSKGKIECKLARDNNQKDRNIM